MVPYSEDPQMLLETSVSARLLILFTSASCNLLDITYKMLHNHTKKSGMPKIFKVSYFQAASSWKLKQLQCRKSSHQQCGHSISAYFLKATIPYRSCIKTDGYPSS